MGYGLVLKCHGRQLSLGTLSGLSDSISNLVSLSQPQTNPSLLVAYDNQSAKTKAATTLDYFCGAVDEDGLLNEAIVTVPLRFLTAAAGSIATFATMITTPIRPIGPWGHRWLLRCFYLIFFRHKRSSDEV
jgi:hypothetical protein